MSDMFCKECGIRIIGGKGDYWHITPDGRIGEQMAVDGHLACPFTTEE